MAPRKLTFHKMHSLGNDFMVLDGVSRALDLQPEQIKAWGDRQRGIGFDQLLIVAPPTEPDADFTFQIYNQDGTEAQQCGNGTRCVTQLALSLGLTQKKNLVWQSLAGRFSTSANENTYTTEMTLPVLEHGAIPFDPSAATEVDPNIFTLSTDDGATYAVTPVSMGNPHGVIFTDKLFDLDVPAIGASLTAHPAFPERANIGFCQVIDRQFIRLRVFERGTGETQACGSGACAAVVAARLTEQINSRVKVSLPGGKLKLNWPGHGEPVTMSGPATMVFRGEVELT